MTIESNLEKLKNGDSRSRRSEKAEEKKNAFPIKPILTIAGGVIAVGFAFNIIKSFINKKKLNSKTSKEEDGNYWLDALDAPHTSTTDKWSIDSEDEAAFALIRSLEDIARSGGDNSDTRSTFLALNALKQALKEALVKKSNRKYHTRKAAILAAYCGCNFLVPLISLLQSSSSSSSSQSSLQSSSSDHEAVKVLGIQCLTLLDFAVRHIRDRVSLSRVIFARALTLRLMSRFAPPQDRGSTNCNSHETSAGHARKWEAMSDITATTPWAHKVVDEYLTAMHILGAVHPASLEACIRVTRVLRAKGEPPSTVLDFLARHATAVAAAIRDLRAVGAAMAQERLRILRHALPQLLNVHGISNDDKRSLLSEIHHLKPATMAAAMSATIDAAMLSGSRILAAAVAAAAAAAEISSSTDGGGISTGSDERMKTKTGDEERGKCVGIREKEGLVEVTKKESDISIKNHHKNSSNNNSSNNNDNKNNDNIASHDSQHFLRHQSNFWSCLKAIVLEATDFAAAAAAADSEFLIVLRDGYASALHIASKQTASGSGCTTKSTRLGREGRDPREEEGGEEGTSSDRGAKEECLYPTTITTATTTATTATTTSLLHSSKPSGDDELLSLASIIKDNYRVLDLEVIENLRCIRIGCAPSLQLLTRFLADISDASSSFSTPSNAVLPADALLGWAAAEDWKRAEAVEVWEAVESSPWEILELPSEKAVKSSCVMKQSSSSPLPRRQVRRRDPFLSASNPGKLDLPHSPPSPPPPYSFYYLPWLSISHAESDPSILQAFLSSPFVSSAPPASPSSFSSSSFSSSSAAAAASTLVALPLAAWTDVFSDLDEESYSTAVLSYYPSSRMTSSPSSTPAFWMEGPRTSMTCAVDDGKEIGAETGQSSGDSDVDLDDDADSDMGSNISCHGDGEKRRREVEVKQKKSEKTAHALARAMSHHRDVRQLYQDVSQWTRAASMMYGEDPMRRVSLKGRPQHHWREGQDERKGICEEGKEEEEEEEEEEKDKTSTSTEREKEHPHPHSYPHLHSYPHPHP